MHVRDTATEKKKILYRASYQTVLTQRDNK